ncbi:MAG TPA: hypothetical protein VIN10_07365 [Bacteroidales bacterium]
MKKLFFLTQFFLVAFLLPQTVLSQPHFNREVGKLIADSSVITCNSDSLLRFFDGFVKKNAQIDAHFDDVKIMKGDGYYYLLAVDNNKFVKSAYELVLDQNSFYEIMLSDGGSTTVVCSGCEVGCNPAKTTEGNWYCDPACEPATCTKTVTVVIPSN